MDIKKKIIIIGNRVHDVGYRPYLLGIAESMEIERFFAKNILRDEKQVVHALVDSSEEKVKAFIDIVSRKEIRTGLTAVKEEIHMQRTDFKEVFMLGSKN